MESNLSVQSDNQASHHFLDKITLRWNWNFLIWKFVKATF